MLLQIPVFFALFNVLRSAIELRQTGFLWAADLSQQDTVFVIPGINLPINPLAICMGLTMLLQQRTMPTSADPMQQKMMMFMTFFFVIMLYPMPSGLTLYWTINQTISVFQYKVTKSIEGNKDTSLCETKHQIKYKIILMTTIQAKLDLTQDTLKSMISYLGLHADIDVKSDNRNIVVRNEDSGSR